MGHVRRIVVFDEMRSLDLEWEAIMVRNYCCEHMSYAVYHVITSWVMVMT